MRTGWMPENVDALLGLGEAMSLRAGGKITPAAAQLFEQAVALAPENPKALLYGGFAAATRGDRALARTRWLALKAHASAAADRRTCWMRESRSSAGRPCGPAAAGRGRRWRAPGCRPPRGRILAARDERGAGGREATVNVSHLHRALKSRLVPEAPLFVFAREPGKPGSAAGRQAPDQRGHRHPDSSVGGGFHVAGACPQERVSSVSITARVSFSGQPVPSAGDLYGELTYDVGRDGVRDLVIDRVAQ